VQIEKAKANVTRLECGKLLTRQTTFFFLPNGFHFHDMPALWVRGLWVGCVTLLPSKEPPEHPRVEILINSKTAQIPHAEIIRG